MLMTAISGVTSHLIGLGLWWFGALLLVDSFLDNRRAARFLWGIGAGVAVLVYSTGWAVLATEGVGRLVVGALGVLLALIILTRRPRPVDRPAAPSHSANGHLQSALAAWDVAKNQSAMGQPLRAGLTYQDGINHLLSCISLTRLADERTTALPRPDDLVPVYHAMAAMGREGLPVMEEVKATTPVRFHARMTLAAAHLADPTEGKPERIREALAADTGSLPRVGLDGDGPLSAETRIAEAAQARLLVARLMVERPDLRWEAVPPWLVGSGGAVSFAREKKRFRQAVLPSCAGLSPDEEMRKLAQESVLVFRELSREVSGYESERKRAEQVLATIRA
ncbi:hypothetical protein [Promicromonospora soli]